MSDSKTSPQKDRYTLSSLDNALKVLDILSTRDNMTLAEISRIAKLDRTSVFKMLYTLERRSYVYKTDDAKYRLGLKFMDYGSLLSERHSITELAMPYLREARDRCRETVYLGTLNTNGRVIITHMEAGESSGSIATRVGFEVDAYTSAMGKVLLAYLDDAMLHSMVAGIHFRPYTSKTILQADELYRVLEEVRRLGYAIDQDERHIGHSGIAAPVFDREQRCVATASIVCRNEVLELRREILLETVLHAAERISARLL